MSEEFELPKPQKLSTERFEKEANELLNNLEEFKSFERRMKQLESNVKKYMIENEVETFKNEKGYLNISYSTIRLLNRALIEDIDNYYENTERITLRKNLNGKSAKTKQAKKDDIDALI